MTSFTKSTKTLSLNSGAKIPVIGLGTWQSTDKFDGSYEFVLHGLRSGYRHIDTAAAYLNEEDVGRAIKDSGVPREEIFVTTKIPGLLHRDPKRSLDLSLKKLGLDYVDLLLIHWPVPFDASGLVNDEDFTNREYVFGSKQRPIDKEWNFIKTWELVQELPATGKVKSIGVSNFSVNNLKQLIENPTTKIIPAINQVEIHPRLPQTELIKFAKEQGIVTEAYCPLGSASSPYWENQTLKQIAEKYGANIGQLLINWGVSRGYVVLPKSANEKRIEGNLLSFELSKDDIDSITNLSETEGELRAVRPSWDWPLFE